MTTRKARITFGQENKENLIFIIDGIPKIIKRFNALSNVKNTFWGFFCDLFRFKQNVQYIKRNADNLNKIGKLKAEKQHIKKFKFKQE